MRVFAMPIPPDVFIIKKSPTHANLAPMYRIDGVERTVTQAYDYLKACGFSRLEANQFLQSLPAVESRWNP